MYDLRSSYKIIMIKNLQNFMSHPHQYLLEEFQIAIRLFEPTIPLEIKKEAQQLHDQYIADLSVSREVIKQGMYEIGVKTFVDRNAYHALIDEVAGQKRDELVFQKLPADLAGRVKSLIGQGHTLDDLLHGKELEEKLSAEDRVALEGVILDAKTQVPELMRSIVEEQKDRYADLWAKWEEQKKEILRALEQLEGLKNQNKKWGAEISAQIDQFKEGFLVTEPDPKLYDVKQAVEYWKGVIQEGR